MNYDLEIILPVCAKNKYLERFKNFHKLGLINHQNYKILLNFLVGTEEFPKEYFFKFSNNIEPKIIKSKYDHPASKVYDFYCNYTDFDKSKWIMRIDDDSITDIDIVMNSISDVDYNKNYYFTAECVEGIIKTSLDVLKKHKLFEKLKKRFHHEVEIALLSNQCFKFIVDKYRKILLDRSTIQSGYTDQLFCYLCKIEGIFPSHLEMLTSKFNVHAFLNKKVGHIHYVKNLENLIDILDEKNEKFYDKDLIIDGTGYLLNLKKSGIIVHKRKMPQYYKSQYAFWHFKNKNLILYNAQLEISKQVKFGTSNREAVLKNQNIFTRLFNLTKKIFNKEENYY
jgi:hypothetical protein